MSQEDREFNFRLVYFKVTMKHSNGIIQAAYLENAEWKLGE
jgi:hypothetical protein